MAWREVRRDAKRWSGGEWRGVGRSGVEWSGLKEHLQRGTSAQARREVLQPVVRYEELLQALQLANHVELACGHHATMQTGPRSGVGQPTGARDGRVVAGQVGAWSDTL